MNITQLDIIEILATGLIISLIYIFRLKRTIRIGNDLMFSHLDDFFDTEEIVETTSIDELEIDSTGNPYYAFSMEFFNTEGVNLLHCNCLILFEWQRCFIDDDDSDIEIPKTNCNNENIWFLEAKYVSFEGTDKVRDRAGLITFHADSLNTIKEHIRRFQLKLREVSDSEIEDWKLSTRN